MLNYSLLLHPLRAITLATLTSLYVTLSPVATIALAQRLLPIPLTLRNGSITVNDFLRSHDGTPNAGLSGYDNHYSVKLNAGDSISISVSSNSFDTWVTLLGPDAMTVAENDDGSDDSTNSFLVTKVEQTGTYIIIVSTLDNGNGFPFTLKLTKV